VPQYLTLLPRETLKASVSPPRKRMGPFWHPQSDGHYSPYADSGGFADLFATIQCVSVCHLQGCGNGI
jgi:hypothetical protein